MLQKYYTPDFLKKALKNKFKKYYYPSFQM